MLVKELRSADVNGAPLLFQAAASKRGTDASFLDVVQQCLRETLGEEEVEEQLQAKDNTSRTILMYAAKGKEPAIFEAVKKSLLKKGFGSFMDALDDSGRSLLHTTARYANERIFKVVLEAYKELGTTNGLFMDHFQKTDKRGRTPLMHLFRSKTNSLQTKLRMLRDHAGEEALHRQLREPWKTSVGTPLI